MSMKSQLILGRHLKEMASEVWSSESIIREYVSAFPSLRDGRIRHSSIEAQIERERERGERGEGNPITPHEA